MKLIKKSLLAAAVGCSFFVAGQAQAVNWLMVQGTETQGAAPRAKLWGFLQPQYSRVDNDKLAAGPFKGQDAAFNTIGPNLDSNSQFQLRRARIGVRGAGFPLDDKINYFILAEFGKNGITEYGSSVELTDASVTFNHIKGARVRVGQFKIPMSEEVYQGIALFDWINFTNYANQQLLERHLETDGLTACNLGTSSSAYLGSCADGNEWDAFGAARDTGIQVFDTFTFESMQDWEFSYSVMVGNGNGLNEGDSGNNKDYHLYVAAEQIYGGKGPFQKGWKTYAWYTKGDRDILNSADLHAGIENEEEYDRKRWGIGTSYKKGKIRAAAEYNKADGMIFNGTTAAAVPGEVSNNGAIVSQFNILPDEEADGWYVDFGYKVMPNLELAVRYDEYNRGTEVDANEREFETWTIGAQYFFNKKTRAQINYEFRDAEAPNLSGGHPANQILDDIGDVISVQVTAIF